MFRTLLAATAAALLTLPALAHDGFHVRDAYARALPGARSGAVFLILENHTAAERRLTGATSDAAERIETHTHAETDGMMRMIHVEEGFAVPAGGERELARGGDHLMMMGLTRALAQGDEIAITLEFDDGRTEVIVVPVDNDRTGAASGGHTGH